MRTSRSLGTVRHGYPLFPWKICSYSGLEISCAYMEMHSKVKPPITVEAGVVGVKNVRLVYNGLQDAMGKMYEPDVVYRAILPDFSKQTRDAFLGTF